MSANVFDELACPECGGQIAGEGGTGLKPCRCFQQKPAPRRRPQVDEPDPVDMVPLAPTLGGAGTVGKPCRGCGKDLTGRTRMKDSRGYICKPCSDAEFAAEADAERDAMKCPECLRKLKPEAFVEYRGSLICKRCRADHMETDKLKVGKVELKKHAEVERQQVKLYAIIAGVLLLIGAVAALLQ